MPNTERLRLLETTELPVYPSRTEPQPVGMPLPPVVEYLLMFALFAGWAVFWIAVFCWIFV
jgi:hypothetical protein